MTHALPSSAEVARGGEPESDGKPRWYLQQRFPLYVTARALSIIGDFATVTALAAHLYAMTGSGFGIAGLFVVRAVARLFGPLGGSLGDRFNPLRLLIGADLLACIVFAVAATQGGAVINLLLLTFLAEIGVTVSQPASRTYIARSIPAAARGRANAVLIGIGMVTAAVGAAVGGFLLSLDFAWPMLLNSGTFLISCLLLAWTSRVVDLGSPTKRSLSWSEFRQGFVDIRADAQTMTIVQAVLIMAFAFAIQRPAVVALVTGELAAAESAYGFVMAAQSVGAFVAALYLIRHRSAKPALVLLVGLTMLTVGNFGFAAAGTIALGVVASLVVGLGSSLREIASMTALQAAKAQDRIGLLMGSVMSVTFLADTLGSLAGGALIDATGARWTLVASGIITAGGAVYFAMLRRRTNNH
ncbi:MFS transporter [Micromonospora profundi]|uniref:MFS transporter n=1 Tax=Micromonospora profundi TaxID=1420889 RepID=UPI00339F074B